MSRKRPLLFGPNWASPQARGLVGWWSFGINSPLFKGSMSMAYTNGAYVGVTAEGPGLYCQANERGLQGALSDDLKRADGTVTFALWFIRVGTPSDYAWLGGASHSNADSNPYATYGFGYSPSTPTGFTAWRCYDGTFQNPELMGTLSDVPVGVLTHFCLAYASGSQHYYRNGASIATPTALTGAFTYGTSPYWFLGRFHDSLNRTPNIIVIDARVYRRKLDSTEVGVLYHPETRWELYQPSYCPSWYVNWSTEPFSHSPRTYVFMQQIWSR